MKTVMTLQWPDDLRYALDAAGYTPERLSEDAIRGLAGVLYARRVLSIEQAAQLAQVSLWDFVAFLAAQGVAIADYDEDEIKAELEASGWLSGKPTES